jgi:hypothetical protein
MPDLKDFVFFVFFVVNFSGPLKTPRTASSSARFSVILAG